MSIFYRDNGNTEAPALVFIHGGAFSSTIWKPQLKYFKDYYCIAPDMAGHGERYEEELSTIEKCAEETADLIKKIVPEKKAYIIGHSFGAQIVVELLNNHPEVVKKAIVNSCALKKSFFLPKIFTFILNRVREYTKDKFKKLYDSMANHQEVCEYMYHDAVRISRKNIKQLQEIYFNYGLPHGLEKVEIPTLILLGTQELGIIKKSMKKLAQTLPGNKAYMVNQETHTFLLQNKQLFNKIIKAWLQEKKLPGDLIPVLE